MPMGKTEPDRCTDNPLRLIFSFIVIFVLTNWDRFALGRDASVRLHDWLDSTPIAWANCFSFARPFDFLKFNDQMVSGYECAAIGALPFAPIPALANHLPLNIHYIFMLFVTLFSFLLGVYYFARAVHIRVPMYWILLLATFGGYFYLNDYVQMFFFGAGFLSCAWLIGGQPLWNTRWESCLAWFLIILIYLSYTPAVYVPILPFASFVLLLIFNKEASGGIRAAFMRYILFWGFWALVFAYPLYLQIQIAPNLMRSEFFPYWGPIEWKRITAEFWSSLHLHSKALFFPFYCFVSLAILRARRPWPSRTTLLRILACVAFISIILAFAFLLIPYMDLLRHQGAIKNSLLLSNHWARAYLLLPIMASVLGILFYQALDEMSVSDAGPLAAWQVWSRYFLFIAFGFLIWDRIAGLPRTDMTYLQILGAIIAFEWLRHHLDQRPLFQRPWEFGLLILVLLLTYNERFYFSAYFEYTTFAAERVPTAESLKETLSSEELRQYKAVAIGFHPAYLNYAGFITADGYSTLYDLTYKRVWEQTAWPALTQKTGEIMPYFQHWGGRAYLFLPGSEEGNFVQKCPPEPVSLFQLAHRDRLRALGVRWIISRCQLKTDVGLRAVKSHRSPYGIFHSKNNANSVDQTQGQPQPVEAYAYDIKDALKITEVVGDHLVVRMNPCRRLEKMQIAKPLDFFGFQIPLSKLEEARPVLTSCYPSIDQAG